MVAWLQDNIGLAMFIAGLVVAIIFAIQWFKEL